MICYTTCPSCDADDIKPVLEVKDFVASKEIFPIWHCSNCSLRFTQNIPDEGAIADYYQSDNYISHTNTRKGLIYTLYHIVRKHTLRKKRKLIATIIGKPTGSLLDIGSGVGIFPAYMQDKGWQVTAIEPAADVRTAALKQYGLQALPTEALLNMKEKFDAITLWHVLEHIHDLHNTIQRLSQLLDVHGKMFIAVPNYTCLDAAIYKNYWDGYDVPRHLYHFSPQAMQQLAHKHNLVIEAIKPMWYDSFYGCLLSEKHKRKGQKTHFIKGMWNGFVSNIEAFFDHSKCSAITYILKRNG